LPALLEAQLFNAIPNELKRYSFDRFRIALNKRLDKSEWLVRIEMDEKVGQERDNLNLATARSYASR
jgi:hypothetical protein